MPRLLLRDFVSRGQCLHVARTQFADEHPNPPHTHDFTEAFWIEQGRGFHHVNGDRVELVAGSVALIRPDDAHCFAAAAGASMILANVAFASSHLRELRRRYLWRRPWPWRGGELPAHFNLAPDALRRLTEWADELARWRGSRLALHAFLLHLLQLLDAPAPASAAHPAPAWLRPAMTRMAKPPHLAGGPEELARLAGRCREHVNRVARASLGKTATELVNDLRMDYAGRELRMTDRPILDVAMDCGLSNLGYFYKLFGQRYGVTPRRYRLRQQAVVRAPAGDRD